MTITRVGEAWASSSTGLSTFTATVSGGGYVATAGDFFVAMAWGLDLPSAMSVTAPSVTLMDSAYWNPGSPPNLFEGVWIWQSDGSTASVTFTNPGPSYDTGRIGWVGVYRNVDSAPDSSENHAPVNLAGSPGSHVNANAVASSVTAAEADSVLVTAHAVYGSTGFGHTTPDYVAWTTPSGMTAVDDSNTAIGRTWPVAVKVFDETVGAGATGSRTSNIEVSYYFTYAGSLAVVLSPGATRRGILVGSVAA